MSAIEEHYETAVDDSRDPEAREQAIDDLETANACSELADVVTGADIDERYRKQALESLAHPQCKPTLERLVERDRVPPELRDRAETLLSETPDDAGAGP